MEPGSQSTGAQKRRYYPRLLPSALPAVKVAPQEGAFTIWIDWRGLGLTDELLFDLLEEKALIQTNHGSEYGEEGRGFCRMNIATPTVEIQKALERLLKAAREAGLATA